MPGPLHRVEVLSGPGPQREYLENPSSGRSQRPLIFLLTLSICLAGSLFYVFQRPAIYRSTASLLTVAPPEVDQQGTEADVQHVAIQSQLLLGEPLLEEVVAKLDSDSASNEPVGLSLSQLRPMLAVTPVPETNLVELRTEGPDAGLLAQVVNTWVKVYLERRATEIRNATGKTSEALRQQYEALGEKIARKREELDAFRKSNDILSIGRDENQVLARLKGLSKSLNDASEEEVKTRARLDAIMAALKRGEAVVPDEDKRSLAQMEKRAQELREQLAELDRNYTRDFLALSPTLKVIPEQLAELERKIGKKRDYGRDIVVTAARREHAAARQAVTELRRQLQDHKQKATEFTARFAEHEALQEDLARMEELYRGTEERLVQIEVKNREKYPQVQVVEWAFQPSEPVRPLYLRDAGIAFAGSVLVAFFVVWLVEFLGGKKHPASPVTLTGVAMYPAAGPAAVGQQTPAVGLESAPSPALESPFPRELAESEVAALLKGADRATRQLISLLLSGVTLEEVMLLEPEDFDLERGELKIRGESPRRIGLPAIFGKDDEPLPAWMDEEKGAPEPAEMEMRLKLAAVDSGLQGAEQIDAQALRHTYLAFLVRQGIRLSELERVVGKIPSQVLFGYGRFSPAEPGKSTEEISRLYPGLEPIGDQ